MAGDRSFAGTASRLLGGVVEVFVRADSCRPRGGPSREKSTTRRGSRVMLVGLVAVATLGIPAVSGLAQSRASTAPCTAVGSCWSSQAVPAPTGGTAALNGVSCASPSFCVAVGTSTDSEPAVAEKWDGSSWSLMAAANPGSYASLSGVSCASSTFCVAVGAYSIELPNQAYRQALAELWDGTAWSAMSVQNPTTNTQLNGISCPSASFCIAVGQSVSSDGSAEQSLSEVWNGATWTAIAAPSPSAASELFGVSCTSNSFCVAAGRYNLYGQQNSLAHDLTLIADWNGSSWALMKSIDPSPALSELVTVSCTSSAFCMAGGEYANPSIGQLALAEQWNGTKWTALTAESPNNFAGFQGVSCLSPISCVGVGDTYSSSTSTIAEQWNGTSWTLMSTANPDDWTIFNAASCVPGTASLGMFCEGVGDTTSSGAPLAESYYNPLGVSLTTLVASPSSSVFGQPVTLDARLDPVPVGGTVQFLVDNLPIGSPVAPDPKTGQAQLVLSDISGGSHQILAEFSGDSSHMPSTAVATVRVSPAPTSLIAQPVSLTSAAQKLGGAFQARVISQITNNPISGQVISFSLDGVTPFCQATTDSAGLAECSPLSLNPQAFINRQYFASYQGNANYEPSHASAAVTP